MNDKIVTDDIMAKKKRTGKSCTVHFDKHMEVKQYIDVMSAYNKMTIADYILNLCIEDYKNPNTTLKDYAKQGMDMAKK